MYFVTKTFAELSARELYGIYFLRSEVFVVEQQCAYQDPDDKDLKALHVMVIDFEKLIGYSRILAPGISYKEASIGRLAVKKEFRGVGAGKKLMNYCIHKTLQLYKNQDIVISAQSYLFKFYTELGFVKEGSKYDEDKIPHVKMRYKQQL